LVVANRRRPAGTKASTVITEPVVEDVVAVTTVTEGETVQANRSDLTDRTDRSGVTTLVAPVVTKPKKVAILGFTLTRDLAPFGDPEFEIWGLNELYMFIPRWTRWFEIHSREAYESDKKRVSDHVERLKGMSCPVYMQRHWDDIPGSVEYPLAAIEAAFPNPTPGTRCYLTNTISYMIALAILEGFEEIHVYGVDMAAGSEYSHQRPSCEYLLGIAQGRGIKVVVPAEADLLKTIFYYGYEQPKIEQFAKKLASRKQEMQSRMNEAQAQMNQLQAQMETLKEMRAQYAGALQDVEYNIVNWQPIMAEPAKP